MTGAELRTIRQRLGLTQAQLALALQRDHTTISRWERGTLVIDRPSDLAFLLAHLEAALRTRASTQDDLDTWLKGWMPSTTRLMRA